MPRFLSAFTCRPWPADLARALAASKGKLLLELIEALSGRPVALKVGMFVSRHALGAHCVRMPDDGLPASWQAQTNICAAPAHLSCCVAQGAKPAGKGDKTEGSKALLAMYEAVLAHLKAAGALVNCLRPELVRCLSASKPVVLWL